MTTHRYTGLTPGVLADGRPLAPGQGGIRDVDLRDPDNQALVDAGALQQEETAARASVKKAEEESK